MSKSKYLVTEGKCENGFAPRFHHPPTNGTGQQPQV